MTDQPSPDATAPEAGNGEAQPAGIRVLGQFIKDLSFENPGILAGGNTAPEIELGIDVRVDPGPPNENLYIVDVRLQATAKREETVVFIVELLYSGLFQLVNTRPEDVEPLLLIECPRLLFPYARRVISDVTRDGGHPPLMVDPIDFAGLYRQQKLQQAMAAQQAAQS